MKAVELFRTKDVYGRGIVEIVIWRVPEPVPPSEHPWKDRLVYVVEGERILGFDNERGKGDHQHIADDEAPYHFTSPQQLMADFWAAVKGIDDE
jgi:hypothetical protein